MTNPASAFFRNKRMWIGFSIAAGISLFNGLSHLYPVLPHIPVTRRFFRFPRTPFQLLRHYHHRVLPVCYRYYVPDAVGCALFNTFFYVLYRNEVALAQAVGWNAIPRFPYLNEQTIGAFVGLCFFFGWTGKRHFKAVLKKRAARSRTRTATPTARRTDAVSGSSMGLCPRYSTLRVSSLQSGHGTLARADLRSPIFDNAACDNAHSSGVGYLCARLSLASTAIHPKHDLGDTSPRCAEFDSTLGLLFQP